MYFSNLLGRREVNCKDGREFNDINERWLRWRREGGYKKGRGKEEKGWWESCLGLWGLVVIVWPCHDFGRPWKPVEVSWV